AKYSDPGSPIRISARKKRGQVRISIRDHGIGIEREMLDRLFDLFFQQPQAMDRSRGGLGLGLAIVRNLVEMHGGAVGVASDGVGLGSEFTVALPAVRSTALQAAVEARTADLSEGWPAQRILIVDDNADAAMMLKDVLESLGHTVSVAPDGPKAIDIAYVFRPDVALLDIGLPVMDGYDLARRLRELPGQSRELKLIAVTGYGLDADRERSSSAGFAAHLVKPVDLAALAACCRSGEAPS